MNYTCPYCGHHSTITGSDHYNRWYPIYLNESDRGPIGFGVKAIRCVNEECNKLFLAGRLTQLVQDNRGSDVEGELIQSWQLFPESFAKILPDFIPQPIQDDYYESCRIMNLSPKASATLARRCLQGMIRDFHGISKNRLIDEIKELEGVVDEDVWESIEAVRTVGNIGAHMEKDINVMIDVDPDEAQLLISLIEQLVDEWYIAREARKNRATKLKEVVAKKTNVITPDQ